jgi:glycosyltransferase involved in cell wall biosynthesis
MRVLLTSNASYAPPRGGSTRSNLVWLRHLAAHGHECFVVAAAEHDTPAADLVQAGIRFLSVREPAERPAALRRQIKEMQPDWVLVSSEDLGQPLLREASRSAPGRVVYLAHTPQFFPFGPESWHQDSAASALVKNAAAVVVISNSVRDYVAKHLGRDSVVVHPPIYGTGPWPRLANPRGAVTMVNPCTVKGLPIFLALADRFPFVSFHALHGWGTTAADEEAMARRPNITVVRTVPDIDDQLAITRVLLMPSLWFEGFGLIVMEAMLRGVPVIASDAGGLVEAKLGTDFVLPVRPIETWEPRYDDRNMPVAVVPRQDIGAWDTALTRLLSDDRLYQRESEAGSAAALRFVTALDAGDFERMLQALKPAPAVPVKKADSLTAEQRALLLRKLRARA